MTPEGKVKKDIKAYLTKLGAWFCMPATGGYGKSGVPDFIACYKGRLIGIEAKAPTKLKNTTTMQKQQLLEITEAGGLSFVIGDVSSLEVALANYFGGTLA